MDLNSRTVYIIRGIPGSGKSTLAKSFIDSGLVHYWVETDKYFEIEGVYKFDQTKLRENHDKAFEYFKQCLNKDGNIVVSNTFVKKWEYERYEKFAKEKGLNVVIMVMNQQFKNGHGVPDEKVEQMRRNFEF
jgi:predicted kinase